MARKKISATITDGTSNNPTQIKDMLLNVTAGLASNANPTWTAFGSVGYETAQANPNDEQRNVMAVPGTISKLFVHIQGSVAITAPMVITLYKSTDSGATWTATALTCTITNPATDANDSTHTFNVNAGDLISIAYLRTAGAGTPAPTCSVQFQPS
jgi:hypothetical protein